MKAFDASYVAGFLDGDGSIHFQLVRQKEYRFGFYIRSSVSFSQSTSARAGLEHIQSLIGSGYLRDRGTGMSDLVVTSRPDSVQSAHGSTTVRGLQKRTRTTCVAPPRPT